MAVMFDALASTKLLTAPGADLDHLPRIAAAFELLVAVLFAVGRMRVASALGSLFFLAAMGWSLVGNGEECGCFGGWVRLRGRSAHVMVAALGGLLSAAVWWVSSDRDGRPLRSRVGVRSA